MFVGCQLRGRHCAEPGDEYEHEEVLPKRARGLLVDRNTGGHDAA